jgi:hypothetical protein
MASPPSQFRSGIDIECPYLWSYGKREKRRKHETRRQQDEDVDGDLRDAMPRLQVGAIIISIISLLIARTILLVESQSHPPIGHGWLDVFNLCCLESQVSTFKLHDGIRGSSSTARPLSQSCVYKSPRTGNKTLPGQGRTLACNRVFFKKKKNKKNQ